MLSRSTTVCAVIAFALATASLHADSITTRDGVSLRGRVVSLDRRGAMVKGRFEEGDTQVLVPREALVSIEFNALSSNDALATLGLPSPLPVTRQGQANLTNDDVVVLRSGERRSCPPIEIDGQRLRCGTDVLPLADVTRLTFGRIR